MLLADRVYDNGLSVLDTEANAIHICSDEPEVYGDIAAITLGLKASPSIGVPSAGDPDGRQVTVAAFADGSVTASGDASHYAIVDTVNSRLLVAGPLGTVQAVTIGNTFSLPDFDIRIPAPV